MYAWICDNPTGPDTLTWKETKTPEPGRGEVRIAIKAASLNFPDLLITKGKYQVKPNPPFVPGVEFAGLVDAVGEGVDNFQLNDKVAVFTNTGGFGTHAVASTSEIMIPLPSIFSFEDASAFLCTYGTSYHALLDRAALKPGETVLVLGAAGGVGTAAIQIAKAAGARVIAAASSDDKCALCKQLGADATINYSNKNLRDELKTLTAGKGPDVIYDPVGGDFAEAAFRSIAWRGRYLVIGFAQGQIPALPLNLALLKGASIVGVFWGNFCNREPQKSIAHFKKLIDWYREGKIKPLIENKLPMSELKKAFALMTTRQVRGKVVLVN